MAGYWRRPEDTAVVMRDGWFHTGDAGNVDPDGFFYIRDRIKDMIISGGENIYPAEVESAICDHPDVAEAAVIGIPDDKWGEAVKAIVVMKPGKQATVTDIINFARENPKKIAFIAFQPVSFTGRDEEITPERRLRQRYTLSHMAQDVKKQVGITEPTRDWFRFHCLERFPISRTWSTVLRLNGAW